VLNRRRVATIGLLVCSIALSANLIRLHGGLNGSAMSAAVVPYTVVLREIWPDSGSGAPPVVRHTYALRSDGAEVTRSVELKATPLIQRTIAMPSGDRAEVDDVHELKTTTLEPLRRPARRDPSRNCAYQVAGNSQAALSSERIVGQESLGGHRAVIVVGHGTTSWLALDLGCAPLQRRFGPEADPSGLQKYESVAAGEPDPKLFEIPSSYREVAPSEFFRLPAKSINALKRDKYYEEHRSAH